MFKTNIDITMLNTYKTKKLVKCQKHPIRDLYIWNYTEIVQMHGPWDDITNLTRGLITDKDGNIKGRSFRKFHNYHEGKHIPTDKYTIYEKMDGSLGILFWHEDAWILCSRGSFVSDQAMVGKYILDSKYSTFFLNKNVSYSFEIIYPENRIVVDYKDKEELIFLAAFDNESGIEVDEFNSIKMCGFPCAKTFDFSMSPDYLSNLNWDNSEGFVIRYDNGERAKIKFQDYLNLHRKVTNLNALHVWEWFKDERILEECIEDIPDEFYKWVEEKWLDYQTKYNEIYNQCISEYNDIIASTSTRAEFAKKASIHIYSRILFDLYDKREVILNICKYIKPVNGTLDTPYSGKRNNVRNILINNQSKLPNVTNVTNISNNKSFTQDDNKPYILILVGISGSGKSTWANNVIQNKNTNTYKVSRDDIRKHVFGYTDETIGAYYENNFYQEYENTVSKIEISMIRTLLKSGKNVIIDNTNLKKQYIQKYMKTFIYNDIHFKVFNDVNIDMCINRDKNRTYSVGENIIRKQNRDFEKLQKSFSFETRKGVYNIIPIMKHTSTDIHKQKCYIFDIDGTLANNSNRNPYDWKLVCYDTVFEDVKETLLSLKYQGYTIIICTGRDEQCESDTKQWLCEHGILYDMFMCRKNKDTRPDWIIKEEMWREISESYKIIAIFDDRDSVVEHARYLGIRVYQVNYGDF